MGGAVAGRPQRRTDSSARDRPVPRRYDPSSRRGRPKARRWLRSSDTGRGLNIEASEESGQGLDDWIRGRTGQKHASIMAQVVRCLCLFDTDRCTPFPCRPRGLLSYQELDRMRSGWLRWPDGRLCACSLRLVWYSTYILHPLERLPGCRSRCLNVLACYYYHNMGSTGYVPSGPFCLLGRTRRLEAVIIRRTQGRMCG